MSDRYKIGTLSDILSLTEDQRERCVKDLLVFGKMYDMRKHLEGTCLELETNHFIWVDDDIVGISEASIQGTDIKIPLPPKGNK